MEREVAAVRDKPIKGEGKIERLRQRTVEAVLWREEYIVCSKAMDWILALL